MTVTSPRISPEGTSSGDQIVVDTRDLPAFTEACTTIGVATATLDAIPAFDLTLVGLLDVAAVSRNPDAGAAGAPTDLDVLLDRVRSLVRSGGGPEVRMGKVRDMHVVEGLPHWASEGLPDTETGPITLAPRRTDPGPALRVAVLDTGLYPAPLLSGRVLSDDLVSGPAPLRTWEGHATFIVGRILLRAPGADVEVRRVLGDETGTTSAWDLAVAMAGYRGSGTDVLNLSLGCFTADDKPPFLLARAVERLEDEMLIVAAAGNHGRRNEYMDPDPRLDENGQRVWRPGPATDHSPIWPGALPGVIAVGSADVTADVAAAGTSYTLTPSDFTPKGVDWIDAWAPGNDVSSTYLSGWVTTTTWEWNEAEQKPEEKVRDWVFGGFARWSGTSMAAGDVTGEIAGIAQRKHLTAREAWGLIRGRRTGPVGDEDIRSSISPPPEIPQQPAAVPAPALAH